MEDLQNLFNGYIKSNPTLSFEVLLLISFFGGLLASLTPCVLPMIPLYLSYIGVIEVSSKLTAIKNSFLFFVGAALVFSLLGIFASFASFVTVHYRGYVNLFIGAFILLMSLSLLEIVKIPLPKIIKRIPEGSPFLVGMAFSLISSPCASPILFSILALSSTLGSSFKSALVMACYSIGYTLIIFVVSVFGGLIKQINFIKSNSGIVLKVCSGILLILGAFYVSQGVMWFVGF